MLTTTKSLNEDNRGLKSLRQQLSNLL